MKHQALNGLFVGFADLTISEVARGCPDFFDGMSLLITCLDSTPKVATLSRWMDRLRSGGYRFETTESGVWISSVDVSRLIAEGSTFSHFDEVYLLKDRPCLAGIRSGTFTTDGCNFGEEVPASFAVEFASIGATRYLSDGCGLNFACESETFLSEIRDLEDAIEKESHQ